MPRVGNPQQGKIYKLVSFQTDKIYIGSTSQRLLCHRFASHKSKFTMWLNGKCHYYSSFELIQYNDCEIVLIEEYPSKSHYELEARERYWIEREDCVNRYIPTRTSKEWIEQHKEYMAEKKRAYREQNIDKIKLKDKMKYENNKEYIKKRERNRYENKKEVINEKRSQIVKCECGVEIAKWSLFNHKKTDKHKQAMERTSQEIDTEPLTDQS
jgi:hypothetical protein